MRYTEEEIMVVVLKESQVDLAATIGTGKLVMADNPDSGYQNVLYGPYVDRRHISEFRVFVNYREMRDVPVSDDGAPWRSFRLLVQDTDDDEFLNAGAAGVPEAYRFLHML